MLFDDLVGGTQDTLRAPRKLTDPTWEVMGASLRPMPEELVTTGRRSVIRGEFVVPSAKAEQRFPWQPSMGNETSEELRMISFWVVGHSRCTSAGA